MSETKIITSLHVVVDTETGQEKIGDIEGGLFPEGFLEKHIKQHGSSQLLNAIGKMALSVMTTEANIEKEQQEASDIKNPAERFLHLAERDLEECEKQQNTILSYYKKLDNYFDEIEEITDEGFHFINIDWGNSDVIINRILDLCDIGRQEPNINVCENKKAD